MNSSFTGSQWLVGRENVSSYVLKCWETSEHVLSIARQLLLLALYLVDIDLPSQNRS